MTSVVQVARLAWARQWWLKGSNQSPTQKECTEECGEEGRGEWRHESGELCELPRLSFIHTTPVFTRTEGAPGVWEGGWVGG